MPRLTRLRASGFKGQTFTETLPERLILHGPNGSGKTSRLEAIRYALQPPSGKEGFAPFMSDDFVQVAVGTDDALVVRSCARKTKDGVTKFSAGHRFEPSAGEKSRKDVDARAEEAFNLQTFVLDMDDFFGSSAPNRRRALLDLLPAIESDGKTVVETLSRAGDEAAPILKAIPNAETLHPLVILQKFEAMAKARLSQIVERKKAVVAALRTDETGFGAQPRPADEVEAIIEKLDAEIEEAERNSATMTAQLAGRKRLEAEADRYRAALPEGVLGAESKARALADHIEAGTTALVELEETAGSAKANHEYAIEKSVEAGIRWAQATGKITALEAMAKEWEKGEPCPFCDAPTENLAADQRIACLKEDAAEYANELKYAKQEADQNAEIRKKAKDAYRDLGKKVAGYASAQKTVEKLDAVEAAILELGDDSAAVVDAANVVGLRARRSEAQAEIRAGAAADERQKATDQYETEATTLEEAESKVRALVKLSGPSVMQGRILGEMVGPLAAILSEFSWDGKSYSIRLTDERGNPDAMLVLEVNGESRPFVAMSGGEKAIGLAALATAVSKLNTDKTTCLLIEAGEIDVGNLTVLADVLKGVEASNVVIATHTPAWGTPMMDDPAWEVRELLA